METRDALDGQIQPDATVSVFDAIEAGAIHPLTGPIYVKGAEPGDALEIEFLDIEAQPVAFSGIFPGLGFLRDVMTEAYLVHWTIADGWATSEQIPGVRIPGAPFMGVSGVAPSPEALAAWTDREQRLLDKGGLVFPPDLAGAVPGGACGLHGLRTLPPREAGGNFDVKQLTKGSKLLLPVYVEGALFSTGDGHFAQGDGEVCVTAVEMGASPLRCASGCTRGSRRRAASRHRSSRNRTTSRRRRSLFRNASSASWACRSPRTARMTART